MKIKKTFLKILLVFCVIALYSCKSEDLTENSAKQFSELKRISKYHSSGLDFTYTQLSSSKTRSARKDFGREEIVAQVLKFIESIPEFQKEKTRSVNTISEIPHEGYELTPEAAQIFENYFDYLVHSSSKSDMENYVERIIKTPKFVSLNKEEQSLVAFMMYIGIDSGEYWSNPTNWEKWKALKENTTFVQNSSTTTRGVAGPPAHYWMTSKQMNNKTFQKYLRADCKGCLYSLVTGFDAFAWAAGGILGSVDAAFN
ncbi:hypothetical protein [Segatella salivae]|uniref:Putative lipoprotein n=1 Tax=Segatella salivae F0493 TaxID=1395125 RepID=U2ML31_9BACT|nr:hypothetical protein [Segatella salivae]ERK02380.1 putative lipoprotein [Segatella salivae F0493]